MSTPPRPQSTLTVRVIDVAAARRYLRDLQQLDEIEPTLLRAAGLVDLPSRDGRVRDIEQIREAVDGLGRNGMEHLDDLDSVMAPIGRLLNHQRQMAQRGVA